MSRIISAKVRVTVTIGTIRVTIGPMGTGITSVMGNVDVTVTKGMIETVTKVVNDTDTMTDATVKVVNVDTVSKIVDVTEVISDSKVVSVINCSLASPTNFDLSIQGDQILKNQDPIGDQILMDHDLMISMDQDIMISKDHSPIGDQILMDHDPMGMDQERKILGSKFPSRGTDPSMR